MNQRDENFVKFVVIDESDDVLMNRQLFCVGVGRGVLHNNGVVMAADSPLLWYALASGFCLC